MARPGTPRNCCTTAAVAGGDEVSQNMKTCRRLRSRSHFDLMSRGFVIGINCEAINKAFGLRRSKRLRTLLYLITIRVRISR